MVKWEVYSIREFNKNAHIWDMVNKAGPNTILLSSNYISSSIANFSNGHELLCVCYKETVPIAATIVSKKKFGVWETFQPSQNPLGAWIHEKQYTIEYLGKSLLKTLPGFGIILGITQQDPELFERPPNSKLLKTIDYIDTARISINKSFEEYWSQRGKNLRQNTNKHRNRLLNDGIQLELRCITDVNEIKQAVHQYADLESAGWKNNRGTAVSIDNEQGAFYITLLESFAKTNNARIYQFWYGDNIAAVDLCIDDSKTFIILKTTYDESIKKTSPANLMRKSYLEEFFTHNTFKKVEFYGRVMDWHRQWTDEIRSLYHINIYAYALLNR